MLTAQQVLDIYRKTSLPPGPTVAQRSGLTDVAALLHKGDLANANARWSSFCSSYVTRATAGDVPAIEKWVLHQSCFQRDSPLGTEIRRWEEKLDSIGDDAQMANIDLQNVLQKQQQTLQMLSTISKMLSDTAMAVIRKIGG